MDIFFETRKVARLIPGEVGPSLVYTKEWRDLRGAFPASTRMPLRTEPYTMDVVVPWVVNLLPESQALETIVRITRIAEQDVMGLLDKIGRDTSGALSFAMRGTANMQFSKVGSADDLERVLNELPKKPFLVGEEGISMSLAGVQTKIGVHLDADGAVCIPVDGAPSTWILKPDAKGLREGVFNEAFCMLLARAVGLPVPEVRIGTAGARKYLLVKRYDRQLVGDQWRRLHQEDFCQALGVYPASKYEKNSTATPGPKFRDLVSATRRVADLPSVNRLLQSMIFNTIVCNTDAHAKNYSMMIGSGRAQLTPIYDVMCGAVWPDITTKLATTVAGKNAGDYLKGRHWQREALFCGLNPRAVLSEVNTLCHRVLAVLDIAVEQLVALDPAGKGMAEECKAQIAQRAGFLINGLKEVDEDLGGWALKNMPGAKLIAGSTTIA